MKRCFIIKGNICYSESKSKLKIFENSYVVCEDGISRGVFREIPERYKDFEIYDYTDKLVVPGFVDLHLHAPQYTFRAVGMDLELLDWLNTYTFKEESKYSEEKYAEKAYDIFVEDLKNSETTRACVFATIHKDATKILMDKLEKTKLKTFVGKVNMDRNSPDSLTENTDSSINDTLDILEYSKTFDNVFPILTPRFVPSCSDELLERLGETGEKFSIAVQSHLDENFDEIKWVSELCPWSNSYADVYDKFNLLNDKSIMAHCVYLNDDEISLILKSNSYVAHCPESNANLASGIAPIKKYLDLGMNVGIGTDIAAGSSNSMLKAMGEAIKMSKLRWRLVDNDIAPLELEEIFYMATITGGSFFGKVGSFDSGYEFDAVVIDDEDIKSTMKFEVRDRIERAMYLHDKCKIASKFVSGEKII